jgi:chromosome segregation ATPase
MKASLRFIRLVAVIGCCCGSYAKAASSSSSFGLKWPSLPVGSFFQSILPRRSFSYVRSLEDQRRILERQLRQNQDEIFQLRKQIKTLQLATTKWMSTMNRESNSNEELKFMKEQVKFLEVEIARIETIRSDLAEMLTTAQLKAEKFQEALADANSNTEVLKANHEREIAALREKFDIKMAQKLEALKILMEQRMEEALEAERKISKLEQIAAVEEAERRVMKDAEKQLSKEQRRTEELVEKEKIKMRKLVKALAEREKKLLGQSERNANRMAVNTSAKSQGNRKPDTVRGPLK